MTDELGSFDGRVAFVTGAARGQGRSHAVSFAERGADVVVCDRCEDSPVVGYPLGTEEDLEETVRLVEKTGRRCLAAKVDTADRSAMEALVDQAHDELGRIDIAVANAGVSVHAPVQELRNDVWDESIATNLTGVFNTIAVVAPGMIERSYGRIVTISSMLGRGPKANQVAYGSAKWGVIGMTKSAAQDLAAHGITVNAIAPGNIDTPMVRNEALYAIVRPDLEAPTFEDASGILAGLHLIHVPVMDPSEVSRVVLFLASEASRYLTGIVVPIDAGAAARLPT